MTAMTLPSEAHMRSSMRSSSHVSSAMLQGLKTMDAYIRARGQSSTYTKPVRSPRVMDTHLASRSLTEFADCSVGQRMNGHLSASHSPTQFTHTTWQSGKVSATIFKPSLSSKTKLPYVNDKTATAIQHKHHQHPLTDNTLPQMRTMTHKVRPHTFGGESSSKKKKPSTHPDARFHSNNPELPESSGLNLNDLLQYSGKISAEERDQRQNQQHHPGKVWGRHEANGSAIMIINGTSSQRGARNGENRHPQMSLEAKLHQLRLLNSRSEEDNRAKRTGLFSKSAGSPKNKYNVMWINGTSASPLRERSNTLNSEGTTISDVANHNKISKSENSNPNDNVKDDKLVKSSVSRILADRPRVGDSPGKPTYRLPLYREQTAQQVYSQNGDGVDNQKYGAKNVYMTFSQGVHNNPSSVQETHNGLVTKTRVLKGMPKGSLNIDTSQNMQANSSAHIKASLPFDKDYMEVEAKDISLSSSNDNLAKSGLSKTASSLKENVAPRKRPLGNNWTPAERPQLEDKDFRISLLNLHVKQSAQRKKIDEHENNGDDEENEAARPLTIEGFRCIVNDSNTESRTARNSLHAKSNEIQKQMDDYDYDYTDYKLEYSYLFQTVDVNEEVANHDGQWAVSDPDDLRVRVKSAVVVECPIPPPASRCSQVIDEELGAEDGYNSDAS